MLWLQILPDLGARKLTEINRQDVAKGMLPWPACPSAPIGHWRCFLPSSDGPNEWDSCRMEVIRAGASISTRRNLENQCCQRRN